MTIRWPILTALLLVLPAGRVAGQGPPEFAIERAFQAYVTDDRAAFTAATGSVAGLRELRSDLPRVFSRWRALWDARRGGFLVEVGSVAFALRVADATSFITSARDLMLSRSEAIGASPMHDQQEVLVHRAAVVTLTAGGSLDAAEVYLAAIGPRVLLAPAASPLPVGRIVDPRLVLAQAVLSERRTHSTGQVIRGPGNAESGIFTPPRSGSQTDHLRRAIAALDLAATFPDTAAEAAVRRALLGYRAGDRAKALTDLDALATSRAQAQPIAAYWAALFLGRLLEAENRLADAVPAYERAARLVPDAQTPAVALASALVRLGRPTDAFTWAATARTRRQDVVDPWLQYANGDLRLLRSWFAQLRQAAP